MSDRSASATFHTVADLCRRWGVSDDTVRRIIHAGDLPHSRIGGQLRVHVRDVEAYEQRGRLVARRGRRRRVTLPAGGLLGDLSEVG